MEDRTRVCVLILLTLGVAARGQSQTSVKTPEILNWPVPLFWSLPAAPGSFSEGVSHSKAGVPTEPLPFIGIPPCRMVDTRDASFPPGYGPPALAASMPRDFTLTDRCGIPASAEAVSLNITVAATQGPGFILIYPQGAMPVLVSTLNYVAGQAIANAAIVPLGVGGITVTAGVSGTELIIDTNGYYAGGLHQPRVEPHPVSPNLIGGSRFNSVTPGAIGATIGGGGGSAFFGETNDVTDNFGTVAGGLNNRAGNGSGPTNDVVYATVGGGVSNAATGHVSTVSGGSNNVASHYATVPGGDQNKALGFYSFAAGKQARAEHNGSFVWNDSTDPVFASSAANEFNVRASGGTRFFTNTMFDTGVLLAPGGNAWSPVSDRGVKENFKVVDGREILARLAEVSIETWNLKSQDPSIRHMGPMAQDFHAAFCLGEDDRHITTIDADGVALAAIQGLYELVRTKDAQIASQLERLESMETRLANLEKLVARGGGPAPAGH